MSYLYEAASRRSQMQVAGQPVVQYGYDNANRLTGITQGSQNVVIGYDNANRRSTLTLPNGIQLTYGFDNANELTGLTYTMGASTVGTMTYGYDSDGRIISRSGTFDITNLPATLASASYDANNRLTNWGGQVSSYDADGNLTGDGTNTYAWNTRNQLTGITGGATASFLYDALGRRESKTISSTSTNFLYDGMNLEQELNGTTPTVNYLTGAGIDETLSRTDSSGTYSYLTDNLSSTLALTTSAGAISTGYSYEPYGNTTVSGVTNTNALQYTGRENDGDGLYYYRARYYSPGHSRFLSEDPFGSAGGINEYTYTGGDPVNNIDPLGLWSFTIGGYAGVGAEITFGNDSGNRFFTFRLGLGIGGGISYDPYGGIPGPPPLNPCKSGVVLSASVQASANVGPLNTGYEAGDARNYNNGESGFYYGPDFGLTNSAWGLQEGFQLALNLLGIVGDLRRMAVQKMRLQ